MKQLRANLLLLLTAMIWGAAFVAQSVAMDSIGPFTFLCSRSVLGGLILLPVISLLDRNRKKTNTYAPGYHWSSKTLMLAGILCGTILFVASSFQQFGIQYTSAGKAGFITAMYMILIPIAGLFLRKRISLRVWAAVVVALFGMYLLCLYGTDLGSMNKGDLLEMACAVGFTFHILVIDLFSPRVDGVKMSCIQFFMCAALSFVFMLIFEAPSWSTIVSAALPICYAGLLSSGVGYTLQIIAQRDTDPTIASLLMSLESVFSLIFGWLILHEAMGPIELLGCGLIFIAIIWVQLPARKKAKTV